MLLIFAQAFYQFTVPAEAFRPGDNVKYNVNGVTGEAIVAEYYNDGTYKIQAIASSNWSIFDGDTYLIVTENQLTKLPERDWVNW